MFEVIPAIDLLDGSCVRLSQGSYEEVTVYGDDPAAVAAKFAAHAIRRLHVVDLDLGGGDTRRCVTKGSARTEKILKALGITERQPPTPPKPGQTLV